jgi:uncharacterized protein YmfQ (DUF2313 family)
MTFDRYRKRPPFSTGHFLHMLRKLLPKGSIWGYTSGALEDLVFDTYTDEALWLNCPSDVGITTYQNNTNATQIWASSPFGIFWSVIASELKRLQDRAYDLVREMVPGLATEMLPEWYEITVRDAYEVALVGDDPDKKRALAHGKIFNEAQSATASWFEEYGATLGFDITVNETPQASSPFVCGVSRCGQRLGGRGSFSIVEITVNSAEPDANLELMQGLFDNAKPAHVVIVWLGV